MIDGTTMVIIDSATTIPISNSASTTGTSGKTTSSGTKTSSSSAGSITSASTSLAGPPTVTTSKKAAAVTQGVSSWLMGAAGFLPALLFL